VEIVVTLSHDFWRDRRVLLTGHTGFKGAWTSACSRSKNLRRDAGLLRVAGGDLSENYLSRAAMSK